MVIRIRKYAIITVLCVLLVILTGLIFREKTKETAANESRRIPVIMYHQICRNHKNEGKYVVDEKVLEKDLIYLKEKGYETVNVSDLVSFVRGEKNLPQKCVMLTFDDGYETGYTILYPLLKKYKMKAVVSVIGSLTELYTENADHNDSYSYLDRDRVRLLSQSDEIEIQNHSFNMHLCKSGKRKGINKLPGESFDEYKKALTDDVGKMQEYLLRLTGKMPQAMVYPFGECSEDTVKICKSLGFKVTLTCEEKVSTLTPYRMESLYNIGRFNRSGTADRNRFFENVLTD